MSLIRPAWESADTIVATAMGGPTTTMVRMGVDGTLEEVADPVDSADYGDVYYWIGQDRAGLDLVGHDPAVRSTGVGTDPAAALHRPRRDLRSRRRRQPHGLRREPRGLRRGRRRAGLPRAGAGHELPEHWSARDLLVGGIATHKLTHLVGRAWVTSPVRAPFTQFETAAGSGEHVERARPGHGVRHTVGELLTCPFCLGVWVGTSYVAGLAVAPRPTRALAAVLTVVAVSDTLQHAYSRLRGD